jgi:hypothetical protein
VDSGVHVGVTVGDSVGVKVAVEVTITRVFVGEGGVTGAVCGDRVGVAAGGKDVAVGVELLDAQPERATAKTNTPIKNYR